MKLTFTPNVFRTSLLAIAISLTIASEAQNKKLLGMTSVGKGIFEYDLTTGSLTPKTNFLQNPEDGAGAHGSLIRASDGKIYGMTYNGGIGARGVIFEYDPITGVNKAKHQFDGTNGKNPYGSLCDAGNGKLYGMTSEGGVNNSGVLFEYVLATGTYTKIIDFKSTNPGSNGGRPYGSLIKASNGKLYGMTKDGGDGTFKGVIFSVDPANNQYAVLAKFGGGIGTAWSPLGDLVEAYNGKLYGLSGGGLEGKGTIFEFDLATNTITVKYYWKVTNANNGTTSEGANPEGSLCLGKDSLLYGLTKDGGFTVPGAGSGVLFTFNPVTGEYMKKKSLDPVLIGSQPRGTLIQASNGLFYGMTYRGGSAANQYGGIFEYDAARDTLISKHSFNSADFQDVMYGKLLEVELLSSGMTEYNNEEYLNVYPNPANTSLTINTPASYTSTTITNLQGKTVLHTTEVNKPLNIESLSNGIYFITIISETGLVSKKFIKN